MTVIPLFNGTAVHPNTTVLYCTLCVAEAESGPSDAWLCLLKERGVGRFFCHRGASCSNTLLSILIVRLVCCCRSVLCASVTLLCRRVSRAVRFLVSVLGQVCAAEGAPWRNLVWCCAENMSVGRIYQVLVNCCDNSTKESDGNYEYR